MESRHENSSLSGQGVQRAALKRRLEMRSGSIAITLIGMEGTDVAQLL